MAFPFLTTKPHCDDPTDAELTLSMVTDPAHSTQVAMRMSLYSDSARTTQVQSTVSTSASSGSVREKLSLTISGLSADTIYYPVIEYEEVSGSGTWVEVADITSDCSYHTPTKTGDVFEVAVSSDPHHTPTTVADGEDERTVQSGYSLSYIASSKRHLWITCGDEMFGTAGSSESTLQGWCANWRDHSAIALDKMSAIHVLGNHEDRDGSESSDDLLRLGLTNAFMPVPTGHSANENFGKFECPQCKIIWAEPYSGSGLSDANDTELGGSLDVTQLNFVTEEIASSTQPVVLVFIHNGLVEKLYQRVGGTELIKSGTDSETIHAALKAEKKSRPGLLMAAMIRGHDHWFEHCVYDGVDYFQCGSPTVPFPSIATADRGYLDANGGFASGVRYSAAFKGCMTFSISDSWVTGQFIRTTDDDGNMDSTVMYSFVANGAVLGSSGVHYSGKTSAPGQHWTGIEW